MVVVLNSLTRIFTHLKHRTFNMESFQKKKIKNKVIKKPMFTKKRWNYLIYHHLRLYFDKNFSLSLP